MLEKKVRGFEGYPSGYLEDAMDHLTDEIELAQRRVRSKC